MARLTGRDNSCAENNANVLTFTVALILDFQGREAGIIDKYQCTWICVFLTTISKCLPVTRRTRIMSILPQVKKSEKELWVCATKT